jgi:thioester reductase-like protein
MNDAPPKVLLTGATGFIGGRILKELSSNKVRLRCLVRSA